MPKLNTMEIATNGDITIKPESSCYKHITISKEAYELLVYYKNRYNVPICKSASKCIISNLKDIKDKDL
jgi:hypothetical protein